VSEPYRMFTSRAEYRLSLRADNADQRLTPAGIALGLVGQPRRAAFEDKAERLEKGRAQLESASFTPRQVAALGLSVNQDGARRTAFQLLSFPEIGFEQVVQLQPELAAIDTETQQQLACDALYANYIERQKRDVDALRRDEQHVIPADFSFDGVEGLSNELKAKLKLARPENLSQAARIDGMTPAALTLILSILRRQKREKSA
jgi:tRNA uridine 5-carboxymethylaminomethyl modification enzyme